MAFEASNLNVGDKCGVLDSKDVKHKVEVVKNDKRAKKITGKLANNKVVTVSYDRCRGLQGKPKASAGAAPAEKPAPAAPKAAPTPAPVKTTASGNGKTESHADLLERFSDLQARAAEVANELYDLHEAMVKHSATLATAPVAKPARGKAPVAPMADDEPDFG